MTLYQIRTLIAPQRELGAGRWKAGLEEFRELQKRRRAALDEISGD